MIEDLVKNLKTDNQELEMHCANAIFKVFFNNFNDLIYSSLLSFAFY